MFKDVFRAQLAELKLKKSSGDLSVHMTLTGILTPAMADDLGVEITQLLETDLQYQSLTVDQVLDRLILNFWHAGMDTDSPDGPYLHLTSVTTKKYKLSRIPDTGVTIVSIPFQTSPVTDADLLKIVNCLEHQVQIQIDQMQSEMTFG